MNGLIIKQPYINQILENKKEWEIRGVKTNIRGEIALIESGTQHIIGIATIIDCIKLTKEDLYNTKNIKKHCISIDKLEKISYKNIYAWILKKPRILKNKIKYEHKRGAIIWVKLNNKIELKIKENL